MMRRLAVIVLVLLCFGLAWQPRARADSSLQSVLFNVNGSTQTDFAGFNTGGYNQTTGLGSVSFTFNPGAAGTYSFDSFFDLQVATPFFNEFGAASGSPASGQTWEIGDSFISNIYNDVLAGGALSNTNSLPGGTDNFLLGCDLTSDPTCNGDAAMAMAFKFTLTDSEEAIITLNFAKANPGGFALSQTHPVDGANNSASTVYFTGNTLIQESSGPPPPPVPEPSSLFLIGAGLGGLCLVKLRR